MKKLLITLIATLLVLLFTGLTTSDSHIQCQDQFILVELSFIDNQFELVHKSLETGCFSKLSNIGIFTAYELNLATGEQVF